MFCDKLNDDLTDNSFVKFKSFGSSTNLALSEILLKLVIILTYSAGMCIKFT